MGLGATVTIEGLEDFKLNVAADVQQLSQNAIAVGGRQLQSDLRNLTTPQLGNRLAKTWRLELYGMRGEQSPAAFVYSKVPAIIQGQRGGTIVPVNGSQYLALPTKKVPRRVGGRGAKARMTPQEVEAQFNQDMILRPGKKRGEFLGLIDMNVSRIRGRKRRSKKQRLVHMFTFKRQVRMPRRINPDAAFDRAVRRTQRALETR